MARNKVLVIDDEPGVRFGIRDFLEQQGYEIEEADSCEDAQHLFRTSRPDIVIADYMLPDGTALDLLPRLKEIDSDIPLLVLTAHGSIDLAVRAIKEGAEQFLTKPLELPALAVILTRLLQKQRNHHKQMASKTRQIRQFIDPFIGTSSAIRALADQARKILTTESPVLILGETGSGKGVMAKWLHENSSRADEAFVDLNCAGLSRELLETELFGHEKGAFTSATASKQGLFEVAHRGTIFLDEVGDVDLQIQPKLLKVLEEKRFRRVGDVRDRQVDVRLIAATHQDMGQLVREKKFRDDLYFRISTIPLSFPSLRDRKEDIPTLAQYLLTKVSTDLGRVEVHLDDECVKALQEYSWPGNVRELRNVIERAVLLSEGKTIGLRDLHFDGHASVGTPFFDSRLTLIELERQHIERVLNEEGGRVEKAAKRLGIPRSSLYQKIKKHQIFMSKV
ncbi:MAG TPA: sigma-54 dependent transcriptional regulator [Pyrinomonadaceae bacterium]|jgi:Response regulator containing CheY-like receiver, AAA-type ATPase, and DNA-binding domains|nr:sigma-54 dependent transcriptional regulator [Pyrinomonadaceae bacterium]